MINKYVNKNELPEEILSRILLTGVVKNQFYKNIDDIIKESIPFLIDRAKTDPEFLMKAACFARNSSMKGMVKVALAAINGSAKDAFLSQEHVRKAAIALLSTFHPGQLLQFVEMVKSKQFGRGFGSRPQKWVRSAMEKWNSKKLENYTLKYPAALNSLVRLVHPRYTDERKGLILYVLDDKKDQATGKKQLVVEEMKGLTNQNKIAELMLDNEIPWDVVKGFAGMSGPLAIASMTQMGLTALLLNIRSLEQHGVFNTNDGITALKLKMNEVKSGRSIPLDFAKPYIYATDDDVKGVLLDAMVDTLDVDMGPVEGMSIGVSVDISGSMDGEPLKTAGLLAVPFLKAKNLWFTTFDTNLYEEGVEFVNKGLYNYIGSYNFVASCPQIHGLSRKNQIKNLLAMRTAGGTDISVSLRAAIQTKRKMDLMVVITDEQQNTGTPLMVAWKQYKQIVNPDAQMWVINASNIEWHSADFGDRSVTVYQTMTPALFKNLEYVGQNIVQAIRNFDLSTFGEQS
jgi:60 kDa SS-A/Ro ribonucleoprotein